MRYLPAGKGETFTARAAAHSGGESDAFILRHVMRSLVAKEKQRRLRDVVPYPLQGNEEASEGSRMGPTTHSEDGEPVETGSPPSESIHSPGSSTSDVSEPCSDGVDEQVDEQPVMSVKERHAMQLLAVHGATEVLSDDSTEGADMPARVIAALQPFETQRVLLGMAAHLPRTLEALLLHYLSPLATELMTNQFEVADDAAGSHEQVRSVYEHLYSVCGNRAQLMEALIRRKEVLAADCCLTVMMDTLNLNDVMAVSSGHHHDSKRHEELA
jgi:hypothetical protein